MVHDHGAHNLLDVAQVVLIRAVPETPCVIRGRAERRQIFSLRLCDVPFVFCGFIRAEAVDKVQDARVGVDTNGGVGLRDLCKLVSTL